MIYAKNRLKTYLEVHSQSIPSYQGNEKEARVILRTKDGILHGIAHRHQGGQRATLPPELQESLIATLQKGESATIDLMGYSTTLEPHNFNKFYSELEKPPLKIALPLPFKF